MGSGRLIGFAIKDSVLPLIDHTYVTSSEGHVWPCFGRSKGGRKICEGDGNVIKLNACLTPVLGRESDTLGQESAIRPQTESCCQPT